MNCKKQSCDQDAKISKSTNNNINNKIWKQFESIKHWQINEWIKSALNSFITGMDYMDIIKYILEFLVSNPSNTH